MFIELLQWQYVFIEENLVDLCIRGVIFLGLVGCFLWWNGFDWLIKDFSEWLKMLVSNRFSEMLEMKISKSKEGANVFVIYVTYSFQKEVVSKYNNICEAWRFDSKRFFSWIRLVRVYVRVRRVLYNLRSRDDRKVGIELSFEEIKDVEEEIVSLV